MNIGIITIQSYYSTYIYIVLIINGELLLNKLFLSTLNGYIDALNLRRPLRGTVLS